MVAWPATLPADPLHGTLKLQRQPNVAEFETDAGPRLRRRRATAAETVLGATLVLSAAQRAILEAFFEADCADGALAFTMDDWVTGAEHTYYWLGPPDIACVTPAIWHATIQIARQP